MFTNFAKNSLRFFNLNQTKLATNNSGMSTCLFCLNRVVTKVTENSVQEVMLSFFGYQIQDYLGDKDAICDTCLNGLDILGHIKKVLLPYIYREDPYIEERKPKILGTQWEYIATLNTDDIPWCIKSSTPNGPNGLNGLVACKRIEPYQKQREKLFEHLEHDRSLSRTNYSQSDIDGEVESIFNKKRRRKRKRWTRRKSSIYSRSTSPVSAIRTRSRRSKADSVVSVETNATNSSINNLRYVNGCLINKRTRSVSRQQEEQAKLIFNNQQIYQCTDPDCDFLCESVDSISYHKQKIHNMMALFWCDDCGNKYTTREELKTHENSEHSKKSFYCTICRASFTTEDQYSEHWQIHVKNSTICKYCKHRYFKTVIAKHQKQCRIARNTRIVVKNSFVKEDQSNFQVKILIQDGVDTIS